MICASRITKTYNQGVNQGNLCHIECIKLRAPGALRAPRGPRGPSWGPFQNKKKSRIEILIKF